MKRLVLGITILLILAFGGAAFEFFRFLNEAADSEAGPQNILINQGSLQSVARMLEQKGILRSARWFEIYGRLTRKSGSIRAGEYALAPSMTPPEILSMLISGKSITYPVTVPEGYSMYEIALLLEQKGLVSSGKFIAAAKDKALVLEVLGERLDSFEGYLFPETYMLTRLTSAESIVREMAATFLRNYGEVPQGPSVQGWTRHQVVTLASIIEKETGVPEERGLVSSVFHNRIKKGMLLQTDPTVIYGVWFTTGVWPKNITRAHLQEKTPYNTYAIRGLPPGPISNPGKESVRAANFPDPSPFLYFVSRNDGTHSFSETLAQHNKAVQSFQLNRKEREGKSWRDQLKKSKIRK